LRKEGGVISVGRDRPFASRTKPKGVGFWPKTVMGKQGCETASRKVDKKKGGRKLGGNFQMESERVSRK